MNTLVRKFAVAAVFTAGLSGTLTVQAGDDSRPVCREVTRQVAIWPRAAHPSKSLRAPTFEPRKIAVCDRQGRMDRPVRTAQSAR